MATPHLIPCRFCGETPEFHWRSGVAGDMYAVRHDDCRSACHATPEAAAEEWNRANTAPIPGPAVLAALAEYTATIYAIDDAPVDSDGREEAFEDWEASRSKMHAAIRAERAGKGESDG